jgi:hypothetical protein
MGKSSWQSKVIEIVKSAKSSRHLATPTPTRIRMYGEEFDLTSNPIPDENGFAIEAISRKSGVARRLRIPLSILQMITKDLAASTSFHGAA